MARAKKKGGGADDVSPPVAEAEAREVTERGHGDASASHGDTAAQHAKHR